MVRYMSIPGFLILWETLSRLGVLNPLFFPPATEILETAGRMFASGEMWEHVRISLMRSMAGLLAAVLVGVPLAFLVGVARPGLFDFIEIPLDVLSQLNPFLLFHIVILFMGIGEAPKITIVVWTCLWPIFFSTLSGVRQVNPVLVKSGRAFGLSKAGLSLKIYLPASLGFIFSGLRMAVGYSLFMLIAAEMMGASSGLGWLVLDTQETFQLKKMYSAVLVIAAVGLILDFTVRAAGNRLAGLPEGESANTEGD
jgi:NitT/TauT family transport system permease protein